MPFPREWPWDKVGYRLDEVDTNKKKNLLQMLGSCVIVGGDEKLLQQFKTFLESKYDLTDSLIQQLNEKYKKDKQDKEKSNE